METGILYAVVAGMFWGSSPVLVKRGLVGSNVSAATLYQQATILLTLVFAAVLEGNLTAQSISLQPLAVFVATGVVGAYLGRTLFVKSVAQIGASRAQSLNNSSPLITVLLAALLLRETLTPAVLGGVLLIVAGVFFVTKTESEGRDTGAARTLTLTSISAMLCYGIVPVLKKLGTDLGGPPVLGALVMHATGLVLLLTLGRLLNIELKWHKLPVSSLACFVGAGVLQGVGSILTLKALLYAPASVVAPIWNTQPIISFFLTKVMLQGIEVVTLRDGVAAALVVAGVLVLRWG
ncbi:MAG TPA: DMT family transporter [Candidatus Binatia bacterium]|nr:DMT family transporter [Candidatus Binatia bacterium]